MHPKAFRSWRFMLVVAALGLAGYALSLSPRAASHGLVCSPPVLDLGKVERGELRAEVTLINRGERSVRIVRTLTSCSCQSVELPSAPIAPGDLASGSFTWDARAEQGESTTSVSVHQPHC